MQSLDRGKTYRTLYQIRVSYPQNDSNLVGCSSTNSSLYISRLKKRRTIQLIKGVNNPELVLLLERQGKSFSELEVTHMLHQAEIDKWL